MSVLPHFLHFSKLDYLQWTMCFSVSLIALPTVSGLDGTLAMGGKLASDSAQLAEILVNSHSKIQDFHCD